MRARLAWFFLLCAFLCPSFAGTIMKGYHYKTHFPDNSVYDLFFNNSVISWAKIPVKKEETWPMKRSFIAVMMEVFQWQDREFYNTIIVDHQHRTFVYSGQSAKKKILEAGKLEWVLDSKVFDDIKGQ